MARVGQQFPPLETEGNIARRSGVVLAGCEEDVRLDWRWTRQGEAENIGERDVIQEIQLRCGDEIELIN